MENSFTSLNKLMKNKHVIIGLLILALVLVLAAFGKPYKTQRPSVVQTTNEQSFDPEALAIRDRIYAKTTEYGAKTKRQTELQEEIERLATDKMELAQGAAAYDQILCTDFKLQYVRPNGVSQSGALVEGCDFQLGVPSAL